MRKQGCIMDKMTLWQQMIAIIKTDVTPATGCTEPIALAYAAATAARELGETVRFIDARVSANLMKNGMGVTVPGTGTPGLYIAAAVGALGGDASAGLQVLKQLTPDVVEMGKKYVADGKVTVSVEDDTPHVLYAEAVVYGENHRVRVIITDDHTNIVYLEKDGKVLRDDRTEVGGGEDPKLTFLHNLTLADIVDFAEHVPLADIEFLAEAERLNDRLSQEGLSGRYGLKIGYTLQQMVDKGLLSDDLSHRIQIRTVAASDARMGGAAFPAMTNSGSGNQGIAATEPVTVVADFLKASPEKRLRALALSSMVAIYAHGYLPKLSAFCATVTASMGAAAGMAWLLAEKEPLAVIEKALATMSGAIVGMVCDGAANSCSMKVSASVHAACEAVLLALYDVRVAGTDGLVADSAEECLRNVGLLASRGMQQTDEEVLKIMLQKNKSVR